MGRGAGLGRRALIAGGCGSGREYARPSCRTMRGALAVLIPRHHAVGDSDFSDKKRRGGSLSFLF